MRAVLPPTPIPFCNIASTTIHSRPALHNSMAPSDATPPASNTTCIGSSDHTQRQSTVLLEKSQYQKDFRKVSEWCYIIQLNRDTSESPSVLGVMHAWPVRETTYPRQRRHLLPTPTGVCPRLIRVAWALQQLELIIVAGPSHRLPTLCRRHGLEPGDPRPPRCRTAL